MTVLGFMASLLILASEDLPLSQAHLYIWFFKCDRFTQHFWVLVTRESCYFSQLAWQKQKCSLSFIPIYSETGKKVLKTQVWTLLPVFLILSNISNSKLWRPIKHKYTKDMIKDVNSNLYAFVDLQKNQN